MRIRSVVACTSALLATAVLTLLLGISASAQTDDPGSADCVGTTGVQQESSGGILETTSGVTAALDVDLGYLSDTVWSEMAPSEVISDENLVSRMGSADPCTSLGVPPEVIEWEQSQARLQGPSLSATYDFPSRLDWRSQGGQDWTTPVRSQGGCGSCVAFGTTAAIESRLEIALGDPELNPDLSEAHLFFCGSTATCQTGWWPSAAMDFSRDTGVADEACYPYSGQDQVCSVCPDWESRVTKISSWVGLTDMNEMKQQLAENGPFEATMAVYLDFYYYKSGVYEYSSGRLVGFHAVTVVGYDDEEGYWIAKNSWGTTWGEAGWFRIAYGQCGIDDYVYVPIMEQADPMYHLYTSVTPNGGGMILLEPTACVVDGCESGTELALTAVPEAGYGFISWGGDVYGDTESVPIVMDSDKAVTASFAEDSDGSDLRFFMPLVLG
jgi:C1A family cysteine protease